MSRTYLADIAEGDRVRGVFLVNSRELRESKQGKPYVHMRLSDKSRSIVAFYWDADTKKFKEIASSDFVDIDARAKSWKDQLQLTVLNASPADPGNVEYSDFLPSTPHDVDVMFAFVQERLIGVENPDLGRLAVTLFADEDLITRFKRSPAAASLHHACVGGLLEHNYFLMQLVDAICPIYPDLDKELLYFAVFLHDLGKTKELSAQSGFQYTDAGKLIGHISIGLTILERALAELDGFPEPLANQLRHIILSHHGKLEFGSPVLPKTPEAIAFSFLDDLDAKLYQARKALEGVSREDGGWSGPIPSMEHRNIYRPPVS